MASPDGGAGLGVDDLAVAVVGRFGARMPRLILIDGPSGSGKSTFADALLAALLASAASGRLEPAEPVSASRPVAAPASRAPVPRASVPREAAARTPASSAPAARAPAALLRMDDFYPGWAGLAASLRILDRDIAEPFARGDEISYPLWDWAADKESGRGSLPRADILLVEGCGAAAVWDNTVSPLVVWVEASDDTRKERALARDSGAFDSHWDMWDAQWQEYVARVHPRNRAHVVIGTDDAIWTIGPAAEELCPRQDSNLRPRD